MDEDNQAQAGAPDTDDPGAADVPSALEELLAAEVLRERAEALIEWVRSSVLTVETLVQGAVVLAVFAVAVVFAPRLRGLIEKRLAPLAAPGPMRRVVAALAILAMPVAAYLILHICVGIIEGAGYPSALVRAAVSLLSAWIVIRLVTLVIRSRLWSRAAFFIAWPVAALDILGLLGNIVAQLDSIAITLGEAARISALDVVRGILAFLILFWVSTVLASFLERRIYKIEELNPSLQVLIVQILKILLPIFAFLIALQLIGVNLAALAIFGGALGLGVGLGLQRSISNLVSGFTLIMDKSIKPGDVIAINDTFGWVTSLGRRYVSIRTRDGIEHLVPNDHFIENGVENWSHAQKIVRLRMPIGISYGSDPHEAKRICEAAAASIERVLQEPPPLCHLVGFGDSSLDMELRIWIDDPENGVTNVRSEVLFEVWDRFAEAGIEIPFPQRDLHIKSAAGLGDIKAVTVEPRPLAAGPPAAANTKA